MFPLLIFFLPVLQIGVSYYASVATLATLVALRSSHWLHNLQGQHAFLGLAITVGMVAGIGLQGGVTNNDVLRAGREAVCFFLITGALFSHARLGSVATADHALRYLAVFAVTMLALVLVQTVLLTQRIYLSLPTELYVMNAGTIPTELDLLYSRIRPGGTYGEPSYLATVSVVLVLALMPLWRHSRQVRWISLTLAAITYLSLSMLGALAMTVVLGTILLRSSSSTRGLILLFTPLLLLLAAVYLADSLIVARLGNILAGTDYSANARVVGPVMAVPELLSRYPTGAPFSELRGLGLLETVDIPVNIFLHNSIFNILFSYGIFGLLGLMVLFASARGLTMKAILFLLLMQNGGFLSFDKVALVILISVLHRTAQALARQKTAAQPAFAGGSHAIA